ncbi:MULTISPECIES: ABC transporter substrate-binding protein [unclassified Bradyrhizobium]|uniref:ABC transporter substrate-binding protein n=1 Tax=unclassified Bradyrhizobium TaxID=2631580 RepID=UPI002FEECF33
MQTFQDRRRFLAALAATATACLVGPPYSKAQDGRLETTTVKIGKIAGICIAPQYVAEELLRAEGFTDIRYVPTEPGTMAATAIARGEIDFTTNFSPPLIIAIDAGEPITILAGEHVGCFELFAREGIRSIPELKGKTVGVQALGSSQYTFVSGMASYVGLEPAKDIRWVTSSSPKPMELFAEGKIDAFLGLPPEPQELRARNIGHVIFNSAIDRPWSHYFCCMVAGNRDYVRRCPVATKRVLRAIIKAADFCATQPERAARQIVDAGFTPRYDYALQSFKEIQYLNWREFDPDDTIRFYSLRLRESGFIRATPNKILGDGTDWQFFNELKRELKG